jgi:hypothetical protein
MLGMANSVSVTVDLTEFTKALKEYAAVSRRTVSESVNKKARDFCFNAAEHTDVSAENGIRDVGYSLFHALAAAKPGGKGSSDFKDAAEKAQERISARFGKGPFPKGSKNRQAANAIQRLRLRARRYSQALWYKLVDQLRSQTSEAKGGKRGPAKKSKIKNTTAKAAIQSGKFDRPQAVLEIVGVETEHVQRVLQEAANLGMRDTILDMRDYINLKLGKVAGDYSGRKARSRATGAPRGRRPGTGRK